MSIGQKLREARGDRTVESVAIACQVTESAIRNYENDIRVPRDEVKLRLANHYGVSIESLFFAKQ